MTKAFVINGTMGNGGNDAFTAVVGVAFFPDELKTLSGRMVQNMGFRPANRDRSLRIDVVPTNGGAPLEPTLYFYERSVTSRTVFVAKLNTDGTRITTNNIALDTRRPHPSYVIPQIGGPVAIGLGFADARNAPGPGDLRKRPPLSAQGAQRRPLVAQ